MPRKLVRNGRIGRLQTVEVGLPGDPAGEEEPVMPVPKNLDYDRWLGSTPVAWGAHHIDCAHWGMNAEYTGPVEVWGTAQFPAKGLWDVHGPFRTEAFTPTASA